MKIKGPYKTLGKSKVLMIEMTSEEAIKTIRSLSEQLEHNSPNIGRFETFCECGTDFSIAVVGDK